MNIKYNNKLSNEEQQRSDKNLLAKQKGTTYKIQAMTMYSCGGSVSEEILLSILSGDKEPMWGERNHHWQYKSQVMMYSRQWNINK